MRNPDCRDNRDYGEDRLQPGGKARMLVDLLDQAHRACP
jgi:hypothetical protein